MTVNAQYILDYLVNLGWTVNSVCGMLGNMQTESTINPGIWQSLVSYDHDPYITVEGHGYGLVQWTPFSKYTTWARDNSMNYQEMDTQLERIIWEVEHNEQWITTDKYPMTFQEFIVSTKSPEYLAQVFITNYERPADPDQPIRSEQARYWYDTLDHDGGGGIDPDPSPELTKIKQVITMLLTDALNGWKWFQLNLK